MVGLHLILNKMHAQIVHIHICLEIGIRYITAWGPCQDQRIVPYSVRIRAFFERWPGAMKKDFQACYDMARTVVRI